jgi:hypothetical protein
MNPQYMLYSVYQNVMIHRSSEFFFGRQSEGGTDSRWCISRGNQCHWLRKLCRPKKIHWVGVGMQLPRKAIREYLEKNKYKKKQKQKS